MEAPRPERLVGELSPEGPNRSAVFLRRDGVAAPGLLSVEDEHACTLGNAQVAQGLLHVRQSERLLGAVDEVVEREEGVGLAAAEGRLHFSDRRAVPAVQPGDDVSGQMRQVVGEVGVGEEPLGVQELLARRAGEHPAERGREKRLIDAVGITEAFPRLADLPPVGKGARPGWLNLRHRGRRRCRGLLDVEDALADSLDIRRFRKLGRGEQLRHRVEGRASVVGGDVPAAGVGDERIARLRRLHQVRLRLPVVGEDRFEDSGPLSDDRREVVRLQHVGLVALGVLLQIAPDGAGLAPAQNLEGAILPPGAGEGLDEALPHEHPHRVRVELESLVQRGVIALRHV